MIVDSPPPLKHLYMFESKALSAARFGHLRPARVLKLQVPARTSYMFWYKPNSELDRCRSDSA